MKVPMKKAREDALTSKNSSWNCTPVCGCRVDAVVSIDERGQMVLPKNVREKAGIQPGDKLALITLERDGIIYCLALMKAEGLSSMVRDILGPLLHEQDNE